MRAVYGIADAKTQGSPFGARPTGRDPPRPCAGSTGETQFQAASKPKFGYDVGLPRSGRWLKLFNSDVYDGFPNPSPTGAGGAVTADGPAIDGFAHSAAITIPANGALFLRALG